jgi:hypothetical protein
MGYKKNIRQVGVYSPVPLGSAPLFHIVKVRIKNDTTKL